MWSYVFEMNFLIHENNEISMDQKRANKVVKMYCEAIMYRRGLNNLDTMRNCIIWCRMKGWKNVISIKFGTVGYKTMPYNRRKLNFSSTRISLWDTKCFTLPLRYINNRKKMFEETIKCQKFILGTVCFQTYSLWYKNKK